MTQYPDNVPTGFAGDRTDFLKVKRDTFGALRKEYSSIAVADSASSGTTYGLIPFQKDFRLSYGTRFANTDLDTATNVTYSIGYLYEDSTLTSDPDAFASGIAGATAAVGNFNQSEGMSFVAEGNGWVTIALTGGPVSTAGTLEFDAVLGYDG